MPTSPTISPDDIAGAFAASGATPAPQQPQSAGPSADDIAGAFASSGASPSPIATPSPKPSPGSYTPKPLNALPPVAQAMFNHVGENCTGTECGQYISNVIASHGGGGTATSLMENPANRVKPGPGGSLPDGTGVFFPSRNGNPNGQHFALTYTDQNGVVRALEDTQAGAGGGGQRRVRADRTLAQIQAEHGTQPVFFRVPGGTAQATPPVQTLPGGAQQYRSPQGADPFAIPGSPIAQFEQQHGGLMARTVQNGLTRAVARSGAVQWFDGKGRAIPPPPVPANAPSFGQQFALAANDLYGEGGSAYKPSGPGFLAKIPADLAIAARGVGQVPFSLYDLEEAGSNAVGRGTAKAIAGLHPNNPAYNETRAYGAGAHQASEAFDKAAAEQVAGLAPYGTGPAILKASQAAVSGDTATAARLVQALPAGAVAFVKQHPVLGLLDTLNIAGAVHAGIGGIRGLRAGEPIPEPETGEMTPSQAEAKPTAISTGKPLGSPAMVSGEGLYTGPKIIDAELRQLKAEEIAAAFEPGPADAKSPSEGAPVVRENVQSAPSENAPKASENVQGSVTPIVQEGVAPGSQALNADKVLTPDEEPRPAVAESEPTAVIRAEEPSEAKASEPPTTPVIASIEAPKSTEGVPSAPQEVLAGGGETEPAPEGSAAAAAKKPASEYAGSINIGKLSDDELKDAYTQRATALGYDNQEPLTRQQMRDQGRALGLTQDALVRLPLGWKPNNVHFGVWLSAVRDADDLAHVAEANAKKVVKADPTPENQAALDAAKKAADATFQRRSAISREWGQSGQVLKTPSDPFAAAKEGDLFRQEPAPVVKTGRMKRVPAEERVKSDTFGKTNTRYTAADTDAAMARIDARFRAAKLPDIDGCKA